MKLADFQSLFQERILAGAGEADRPLLKALRPSGRGAKPETLLGVYQSGYRVRLAEFLAEDHPGLRALIGDERFDALVDEYIDACPPRNPNARWYTTGLPDFMRASETWREHSLAVSMAVFERAMVDATDAADAAPLSVDALAKFPPDEWPRLAFSFHPSLTLLELSPGVLAAYGAESEEGADEAPAPQEREFVAVWREEDDCAYRQLESDEYVALCEARAGRAFGDICQMAAFQQSGEISPERLAQFLSSWFADGLVIGATARADHSSNTPSSA